jgi:hypothetical protein
MQRFGIADDKLHFPNDKLPHRQHRCHFHSSAIAEASYRIGEGMDSWHALFVSYRSTIKWISTYHASAHFLSPNPTWLRSCGCCVGTCNLQACIFEPETKSTFEPSLRASCMSISCGGHDGIRPQGLMLRTVRLLALRLSCSRNGHQVVASSVGMPLKLKQVFIPPVLCRNPPCGPSHSGVPLTHWIGCGSRRRACRSYLQSLPNPSRSLISVRKTCAR